jgi:hypothetical protein
LERKKQQQPVIKTNSIEAAIAEIRRINGQIAELDKNAAPARAEIIARYDKKIAELNGQQRDEFEKERDFRERIQKESGLLETRKQNELAQLAFEATALREGVKHLSEKEYTLDASQIEIVLGKYDVEKEMFPVVLKNKPMTSFVVAVNGNIPLPALQAKALKQQFEGGLVRPQVQVRVNGSILKSELVNEAESDLLELVTGEFITVAEKQRRTERNRIIFTDPSSGLMWVRNGNFSNKKLKWDDAIGHVKNLNYGGYRDWRLPTKEELEAFSKLNGENSYSEWFNANGFNSVQSGYYWSSNTHVNYTNSAWIVNMDDGVVTYSNKSNPYYVWPVRVGQ